MVSDHLIGSPGRAVASRGFHDYRAWVGLRLWTHRVRLHPTLHGPIGLPAGLSGPLHAAHGVAQGEIFRWTSNLRADIGALRRKRSPLLRHFT